MGKVNISHKGFRHVVEAGLQDIFAREFVLADLAANIFRSSPYEVEDWEIADRCIQEKLSVVDIIWMIGEAEKRHLTAPAGEY